MRGRKLVRTVGTVTGALGFAAACIAALAAFGSIDGRTLAVGPAVLAVASVPLIWAYLVSARGYRRLPFWAAALTGTVAVLGAVSYRDVPATAVNAGIAIVVGLVAFACARVVMSLRYLNARRFLVAFGLFTAAALFLPALFPWGVSDESDRPAYHDEIARLIELLDPAHESYREEIEPYLERAVSDETVEPAELDRVVERLNRRIAELEAELERFSVVEHEKDAYAEQVARLRREIELIAKNHVRPEDFEMVAGYAEAVRPAVPIVRDFAVRLAAEHPGPFHRDFPGATPSREGVLQALTIHRYIASEWKYVNDPVFAVGNYYSPADRTIALGLAGDCDDFATVIASTIEAIGGRARIVHGTCDVGGHAWAELFIGDRTAWRTATAIVSERYPGRTIESIRPTGPNDHWLPLDWQVGVFTCGESPRVQYVSR